MCIFFSILGSPFLLHVKEILNPESTVGAPPWVYYSIYAFFVFLFNIFDIVSVTLFFSVLSFNLPWTLNRTACFVMKANLPKEIADYLNKMGARIPNIKPGKATIEYLTKIQASTRFWGKAKLLLLHCRLAHYNQVLVWFWFESGGLLLSFLATSSSVLDHYLRSINQGFSIGFTSVLIIASVLSPFNIIHLNHSDFMFVDISVDWVLQVGSIIELRRSYHAYNVMPSLSKALKMYGVWWGFKKHERWLYMFVV